MSPYCHARPLLTVLTVTRAHSLLAWPQLPHGRRAPLASAGAPAATRRDLPGAACRARSRPLGDPDTVTGGYDDPDMRIPALIIPRLLSSPHAAPGRRTLAAEGPRGRRASCPAYPAGGPSRRRGLEAQPALQAERGGASLLYRACRRSFPAEVSGAKRGPHAASRLPPTAPFDFAAPGP